MPIDGRMQFGNGRRFRAQEVVEFLGLSRLDVARLAFVAETSARYDAGMPATMRTCLEEWAATVNLVANQFQGDVERTAMWFKARNPLLGDIAPRDMIRLGRHSRLRRFITAAVSGHSSAPSLRTMPS